MPIPECYRMTLSDCRSATVWCIDSEDWVPWIRLKASDLACKCPCGNVARAWQVDLHREVSVCERRVACRVDRYPLKIELSCHCNHNSSLQILESARCKCAAVDEPDLADVELLLQERAPNGLYACLVVESGVVVTWQ